MCIKVYVSVLYISTRSECCTVLCLSLCCVWLFATPWTTALQASLSFTISWSLLKLMFNELVMPSNYLILCRLLLLPSIFPSIRVFPNEVALYIRQPKYWSFSFSISPSYEYSGLISFRIDWFDLLAVQGTLKSLQHHCSKASILQRAAFLTVQLSHLTLYFTKQNKQTKKTTRLLQWSQSECYGGLCWAQIWVWGTGEISCPKQMRMKWVSWENPPLRKGDLGLTSDTWQHYKKVHFWIQLFS